MTNATAPAVRRRRAALLLSLTILAPLAGCRPSPGSDPSGPATPPGTATTPAAPLAVTGWRVEWAVSSVPPEMRAGERALARVGFRNTGGVLWPDRLSADPSGSGVRAVRLGYRWRKGAAGPVVVDTADRADLPRPLAPGESASLTIDVIAPAEPGSYTLEFDLVQENVAWFGARGAKTSPVAVKVK